MTLNADIITEPTSGRYCEFCDVTAYNSALMGAHRAGPFWHVPASNGEYYMVRGTACTCPSFHFGIRPCKHMSRVARLIAEGKTHDLPWVIWEQVQQMIWPPEDPTLDDLLGSIG